MRAGYSGENGGNVNRWVLGARNVGGWAGARRRSDEATKRRREGGGVSERSEFSELGHLGTFWDICGVDVTEGMEAPFDCAQDRLRHVGTEWGPGGEGTSGDALVHLLPYSLNHHFVPSCLDAFVPVLHYVPLRKTGAVMRFGEHF